MIYGFAKLICSIYFRLFFKFRINGRENVPPCGAVILCGNHISYFDPITMAIGIKRRIAYIAKKELFKNNFFGYVLRDHLGAIPVDRGSTSMSTFRDVLKVLNDGEVFGIFAQGTRIKEIEAKDAKAGVALFAVKSGATVIPVNISSTYKLFSEINVTYGKPIDLTEYHNAKVRSEGLEEIAGKIMNEVMKLGPDYKAGI